MGFLRQTQAAGDGLDHRLVAGAAPRRALRWGWRWAGLARVKIGWLALVAVVGTVLVRGGRGDQRSSGTGGRLRASVFESGVVAVR